MKGSKKLLISLYHYFSFFLFMAFIISCSMLLFLSTMAQSMNITYTEQDIDVAAKITFLNVVFLSLLCTVIDALRRKLTVERPVKRIVDAADRIAHGDYSVRIRPLHGVSRNDGLDRVVDCFNSMAQELSSVRTMQSDFISNVSHELKTPLAIIGNCGTLLQSDDLSDADKQRYAGGVSDAAHRLATLVTNILRLNKLENSSMSISPIAFDLSEQLCESVLEFEEVWESKDISIDTAIPDSFTVTSDPELLRLVWSNLLSNALKFTEPGGSVTVTLTEQDGKAQISVSDTGCGISQETGRHIFDKFYQGDTSHSTEGNGLGLALVHRVVTLLGGDISVASCVGQGSTFTVKIGTVLHG